MDPFIGLEKKEEQQSWYQAGRKALDLWGSSAVAGGQFESSIYQLRPNQTRPSVVSAFHMLNLTFASSQLDLLKLDWSKRRLHASVCKYVRWGAPAGGGPGAAHAGPLSSKDTRRFTRRLRRCADVKDRLTICSRISCWPVVTSANPEHTHEYI